MAVPLAFTQADQLGNVAGLGVVHYTIDSAVQCSYEAVE
jgi:hypothetical protein